MIIIFNIGAICILLGACAIIWSIYRPDRRLWPLSRLTPFKFMVVWGVTCLAFGACIALGVMDWNSLGWPNSVRFGIGVPLILIGHIVVYLGVKTIGLAATSGARAQLRTDGIYRYSRNPQYLADMSSLVGWGILSASLWAVPLALSIMIVFALTPFSEESWLREAYGQDYDNYVRSVPRFI